MTTIQNYQKQKESRNKKEGRKKRKKERKKERKKRKKGNGTKMTLILLDMVKNEFTL
jgi:hypothetical protein